MPPVGPEENTEYYDRQWNSMEQFNKNKSRKHRKRRRKNRREIKSTLLSEDETLHDDLEHSFHHKVSEENEPQEIV